MGWWSRVELTFLQTCQLKRLATGLQGTSFLYIRTDGDAGCQICNVHPWRCESVSHRVRF